MRSVQTGGMIFRTYRCAASLRDRLYGGHFMNQEIWFAKTLEQVKKQAREQGGCISEAQVREAFVGKYQCLRISRQYQRGAGAGSL